MSRSFFECSDLVGLAVLVRLADHRRLNVVQVRPYSFGGFVVALDGPLKLPNKSHLEPFLHSIDGATDLGSESIKSIRPQSAEAYGLEKAAADPAKSAEPQRPLFASQPSMIIGRQSW